MTDFSIAALAAELISHRRFQATIGDCTGNADLVVEMLSAPCRENANLCNVVLALKPTAWTEDTPPEYRAGVRELYQQMLRDGHQTRAQWEAVDSDLAAVERPALPAQALEGLAVELTAFRGAEWTVRRAVTDLAGRAIFHQVDRGASCTLRATFGTVDDASAWAGASEYSSAHGHPELHEVTHYAATSDSGRTLEIGLAETGIHLALTGRNRGCYVALKTAMASEVPPPIAEIWWEQLGLRVRLEWARLAAGLWDCGFAVNLRFEQIATATQNVRLIRAGV